MKTISISQSVNLDFHGKEAYRTLRSNIQFCGSDIKVIGITSCMPGEGKSSVALNLAVSIAEADKRVLFIDADLRKSVLTGRYKIDRSLRGLSHYLSGLNSMEEIINEVIADKLDVVFSGAVPPNPSELLGGERFARLIQIQRDAYDYMIIDTPPLGSVIDSAVIAKLCDGMIIVIEAGKISYKLAQEVKAQMDKTGCRLLGAVLNKADAADKGYYGKYYKKYNVKYYEHEKLL